MLLNREMKLCELEQGNERKTREDAFEAAIEAKPEQHRELRNARMSDVHAVRMGGLASLLRQAMVSKHPI
jgi:hypothetical protein